MGNDLVIRYRDRVVVKDDGYEVAFPILYFIKFFFAVSVRFCYNICV